MEVHGRQPDDLFSARERYKRIQQQLQGANRDRARQILEGLSRSGGDGVRGAHEKASEIPAPDKPVLRQVKTRHDLQKDVLELSSAATALDPETEPGHAEKLHELRAAFDRGTLNTPERIERAAHRILNP